MGHLIHEPDGLLGCQGIELCRPVRSVLVQNNKGIDCCVVFGNPVEIDLREGNRGKGAICIRSVDVGDGGFDDIIHWQHCPFARLVLRGSGDHAG